MSAPTARPYSATDIAALSFWRQPHPVRDEVFAKLRAEEPISWQRPPEGAITRVGANDGYWAVMRHSDINAVSRDPATFCSGKGVSVNALPMDLARRWTSFLVMDAPEHTRLRKAVVSVFSAREVKRIETVMQGQARLIVDDLIATGPCDFVQQVSVRLPAWISSRMLGVPESETDGIVHAADVVVRSGLEKTDPSDPAAAAEKATRLVEALEHIENVGRELARTRRQSPADDLMTKLVQAEAEGGPLTEDELTSIFCLLTIAGNDTTRHTTSWAMRAFTLYPEQKQLLIDDFETHQATAIEECFRWATPIASIGRTATRDAELNGVRIAEGERVVMFLASGNRDEAEFSAPFVFDVTRTPNRHVSFGGPGPHYCLGANLARATLRSLFRELFTRVPDLQVGEPETFVGQGLQAVTSMECTFTP